MVHIRLRELAAEFPPVERALKALIDVAQQELFARNYLQGGSLSDETMRELSILLGYIPEKNDG